MYVKNCFLWCPESEVTNIIWPRKYVIDLAHLLSCNWIRSPNLRNRTNSMTKLTEWLPLRQDTTERAWPIYFPWLEKHKRSLYTRSTWEFCFNQSVTSHIWVVISSLVRHFCSYYSNVAFLGRLSGVVSSRNDVCLLNPLTNGLKNNKNQ